MKHYFEEAFGTFGFVFLTAGAVIFSAPFIGYLGTALATGIAYAAMLYTFKFGHFNPALTISSACAGAFSWKKVPFYLIAQTIGAFAAAMALAFVLNGKAGYAGDSTFAAGLPKNFTPHSILILEGITTVFMVVAFLATLGKKEAPAAMGLILSAAALMSYPITKGGLNPIKSTALAFYSIPEAVGHLWVFWTSSISAAVIVGLIFWLMAHQQRNVGVQN